MTGGLSGLFSWVWDSYGEVIWDGVNFSMQWEQYNHSEVMTGRVYADGTIIEQLIIRHEFGDHIESFLSGKGIGFLGIDCYDDLYPVEHLSCPLHDIDVTEGRRIEGTWIYDVAHIPDSTLDLRFWSTNTRKQQADAEFPL